MVGCHASRQIAVSLAFNPPNINKVPKGRQINQSVHLLYFRPAVQNNYEIKKREELLKDKKEKRRRLCAVLMYLADTTPPAAPEETSYDIIVLSSTL